MKIRKDIKYKSLKLYQKIIMPIIIICMIILSMFFRAHNLWNKYNGFVESEVEEIEKEISETDIVKPVSGRFYFEKIKIITTITAGTYPFLSIKKEEVSMGFYSRNK
jgi:hypothetical protein